MSDTAYVFPGQGSQALGMGREVFEQSTAGREAFLEADEVLGRPLSNLCFEGPAEELRKTHNAQPAILTVSVAVLRAVAERNGHEAPAFLAGHSLGECTALVAAEVLNFPDALRLVYERGRLMDEAAGLVPGGMAAVIGLDATLVEEACAEAGAEIANLNSEAQIIISGSRAALARAVDLMRVAGARRVIPLDVSGAFHSSLMEPARAGLRLMLAGLELRTPRVPIVANTTAEPLLNAEDVREELIAQICHCVYWERSVRYMISAGVRRFYEIGPGATLSALVRRIDPTVTASNIAEA